LRARLAPLAWGLALAVAAGCQPKPTATPEQYSFYCVRCHGANGEGEAKTVRRYSAADLRTSPMMERGDRLGLRHRIAKGYGPMPAFSRRLTAAEIERMIDFILQLRENHKKRT
jgi:mono/diheme cytochrome c family protein